MNSAMAQENVFCFSSAVTAMVPDGLLGNNMTRKVKKNIVWFCLFCIVAASVGICMHNRALERKRQALEQRRKDLETGIGQIRESRRLFNAKAMRDAGVSAKIADGNDEIFQHEISNFCDLIKLQYGTNVSTTDVAMWHAESNIELLLTADRLYMLRSGTVQYWDLIQMEVSSVEWERKKNGDIFIGGERYHFLVDCRKPFTDAIRRIIVNSKVHREDDALNRELQNLE